MARALCVTQCDRGLAFLFWRQYTTPVSLLHELLLSVPLPSFSLHSNIRVDKTFSKTGGKKEEGNLLNREKNRTRRFLLRHSVLSSRHTVNKIEVAPITRKSNHMPIYEIWTTDEKMFSYFYLVAMIQSPRLLLLPSPPVVRTKVDHLTTTRKIKINMLSRFQPRTRTHTHT